MSEQDVRAELGKAFDSMREDGSFRISHPGTIYGRDGRRRTGI